MTEALVRSEEAGVEVTGISVGQNDTFVSQCYKHWISNLMSAAVPDALREPYSCQLEEAEADDGEGTKLLQREVDVVSSDGHLDVSTILQQQKAVFTNLAEYLQKDSEMKLVHGSGPPNYMSLDLCFCVDVTGSMRPFTNAIKAQIEGIINHIIPKIHKAFPNIDIKLRTGLVAYRDFADNVPFGEVRFSGHSETIVNAIRGLHAEGGGDKAEDILGGLDCATSWDDWRDKAKFLVLMADASAHGSENSNDENEDHYYYSAHSNRLTMARIVSAVKKKKIQLMFCRISEQSTRKMESNLRRLYNDQSMNVKLESIDLFDAQRLQQESGKYTSSSASIDLDQWLVQAGKR